MIDDAREVKIDLASLYYQLAALEVVVSHTLGSLTTPEAKAVAAAAFRGRSGITEVQAHLDRYADNLLHAAQYRPTASGLEVIDGSKDDLQSDNDDAA